MQKAVQRAIKQVQALLDVAEATGRGGATRPTDTAVVQEVSPASTAADATDTLPDGNLVLFMPAGEVFGVESKHGCPGGCLTFALTT